jgi:hypothetical protein
MICSHLLSLSQVTGNGDSPSAADLSRSDGLPTPTADEEPVTSGQDDQSLKSSPEQQVFHAMSSFDHYLSVFRCCYPAFGVDNLILHFQSVCYRIEIEQVCAKNMIDK